MLVSALAFALFALIGSLLASANHARAAPGDLLWAKRFGDSGDQLGSSVAMDGAGNALFTGEFTGSVDFGGGPLTSAGSGDIFLAKFDPAGNHLWSKRFGDANAQYTQSVAVDSAGNVLLTGYFYGSVNFGGAALTSAGSYDIFVAKFDPTGNHLWSKRFGDVSGQVGYSLAADGAGNVLLTGYFSGSVNFGGGALMSAGAEDIFVAKFDAAGNYLWSKPFGEVGQQVGYSIAVDGAGKVLLTGGFYGSVDFGGGALTSAGSDDVFLAKFDPAGNYLWSKRFGDSGQQFGRSVTVDGASNALFTGEFSGSIDFGGGPQTSAGLEDIFLAKFDPAGNYLWSKRFGDGDSQNGYDVAVDGAGRPVITGWFSGSVDFGGGALGSAALDDIFLAKFDASGNHIWSKRFGDSGGQLGVGVVADNTGSAVLTGQFVVSVDFGGGPLTSAGGVDTFLAKFAGAGLSDFKQMYLQWGASPYGGSVSPNGPCTYSVTSNPNVRCTIASHGCLLSAVADVLTYYGVATNPLLLNNAMVSDGWRDGYVSPRLVSRYSHLSVQSGGYNPAKALSFLSQGKPVIVRLDTGGDGHWVVLTAPAAGEDFHILDPGTSKTLLSQYSPSPALLKMWVINGGSSVGAQARSPVAMLLTDPVGRRTGYDPASGSIVNEIPDSGYDVMGGIENDVTNADGIPGLLSVYTNAPVPGTYTLQITGTGTGPYEVDAWTTTNDGTVTSAASQGDATPGSSATITVNLPADSVGGIAALPNVTAPGTAAVSHHENHNSSVYGTVAVVIVGLLTGASAWRVRRRSRL